MNKHLNPSPPESKPGKALSLKPKVALARCTSYERSEVRSALEHIFKNLGQLRGFVGSGKRIFVKVNHLSPPSPPDRAVQTHPAFTREVLRLLLDCSAKVTVGDDIQGPPGDGFTKSGYRAICSELGVRLVNLKETGFVEIDIKGEVIPRTYIARPVLEADAIVNLPKLKTHSFTIYTGAIKNMFGVIPHGLRLNYHRQFIRNDVFARMLVDLFFSIPPRLNLMDAVMAMEGEGPSAGYPRHVGLVLASADAVALDAVACQIVGFNPLGVHTTAIAHARQLGVGDIRQVETLGPALEEVTVKGFKHSAAATGLFRRWLPSILYASIQEQLILIPEVRQEKCTACLECVQMCPRQAISLIDGAAFIREEDCIHCLCCHELCAHRAIRLKQLPVGRLIRQGEKILGRLNRIRSSLLAPKRKGMASLERKEKV